MQSADGKSQVSSPSIDGAAAMSPGLVPSSQPLIERENNVQPSAAVAPSSPVPLPRSKRKPINAQQSQTSAEEKPKKAALPVTADNKEQAEPRKPALVKRPPPLVGTGDRVRKKGI